jgi:hypothetical protein
MKKRDFSLLRSSPLEGPSSSMIERALTRSLLELQSAIVYVPAVQNKVGHFTGDTF